jgi:hypothetical protein
MPKLLRSAIAATSFILALNAIAQTAESPCSVGYSGIGSGFSLQIGMSGPYTLTARATYEHKLWDGNTISGYTTAHQMRDSQGRIRTESPTSCRIMDGVPTWQGAVTITDTVEKRLINWQVFDLALGMQKTANVVAITPPPPRPATPVAVHRSTRVRTTAQDDEQRKTEDLGRRNIAGLEAVGTRITRVVPAGKQGNAQPLAYSEEIWRSKQYGVVLLAKNDDPVYGTATYEVTDFQPVEPDASAFEPPKDYKVEEVHLAPQHQ